MTYFSTKHQISYSFFSPVLLSMTGLMEIIVLVMADVCLVLLLVIYTDVLQLI